MRPFSVTLVRPVAQKVWFIPQISGGTQVNTMSNGVIDCFTHPVTAEVNASGLRCPLPLLKAKQALRDLAVDGVLRVLATDAGSVRDFQAFATISGHGLIGFDEREGTFCYLLKKASSANAPVSK